MCSRIVLPLAVALAMAVFPAQADGQVGGTTDILTGVVVSADGIPLAGVLVEAFSLETEISRTTRTDRRGRYSILFPDGGGQYRMSARAVGMAPQTVVLARFADEDRIVWDVELAELGFGLDTVTIRGTRRPVVVRDRPTPGSIERNLSTDLIAGLPIDPEDLNVLATLVPGVVGIDATDSTGASFSVAGQRPDANSITLDGLSFNSGQVPQEGLRNTRVVTSTYDVSRGRFSGGLISSTSRGGSNRAQGSFSYNLRDDALAVETGETSAFTSAFTQQQFGGGFGGPLVRNRLFAYVSASARLRTDPQASLAAATSTDLQRLGVSPDSVGRFMSIVDGLGVPSDGNLHEDRSNDFVSTLLRLDYLISNNHTLTLRGDYRSQSQEPSRLSAFALPQTGGDNESTGGGLMASLSSRLGLHFINQVRAYVSMSSRSSDPFTYGPQGQVQVGSQLEDGTVGIRTLSFGGNTRMPVSASNKSVEMTNELSWLPGTGTHRVRLGGLFGWEQADNINSRNQFGIFSFNSLDELETGTAALFRRTLAPDERSSQAIDYAIYAGDVWRASRAVQLTYGLRLEGSTFRNPPAFNPALDSALGIRTDRLPSEVDLSPRVGFTWTIGGTSFRSPPDLIVRGGVGRFRSPISLNLVSQTQTATGLSDSEAELNCVGAAIPTPDWNAYDADGNSIPTTCNGPSTPRSVRAPSATVFENSFRAAKSWRGSLGIQRNLTSLLRLSVNASYARGVSQYGFRDLNLNTNAGFQLPSEQGRPVFVDPALVVPSTGAVRLSDSRINTEFSQVLDIGSDLESETKQLSVSLGGITRTGIVVQTSYTWSNVRDQSSQSVRFGSGSLGGATTGGNPNVREWSRSSFERKHSFLTTISYPFGTNLEVTAIGRLSSGRPYTPMVATDINGDGSRNDRAFIPLSGMSPGIARLLESSSAGGKNCLRSQQGQIAARNSCTGPWEASFDLQMNYRPNFLGMNRNVSFSLTTLNLLRGIDELIHGTDGAHGWGLRARPDQTLLFVEAFDPSTNEFVYRVNERFGATDQRANAFRTPFQVGIQVRASFGPNRGRAALDRLRGGGGGRGAGGRGGGRGGAGGFRGGGGGFTADDFLDRFQALLVNPAGVALELSDSLKLTASQVIRLTALRDSLTSQNDSLAEVLQSELEGAGGNENPRGLIQLIRPRMQEAQENARASLDKLRDVLTKEQWELLPKSLKEAGDARQGRRGAG